MKRVAIILLFLSCSLANVRAADRFHLIGTPPDSTLVTMITTSYDTLRVKIIKISLDYYYVLPRGSDKIIKYHKSRILRLIYPSGLVLNVAQSYRKNNPPETNTYNDYNLAGITFINSLFALLVLGSFMQSGFSPLTFFLLTLDNFVTLYHLYLLSEAHKYLTNKNLLFIYDTVFYLISLFIILLDIGFVVFFKGP